MCCRLRGGGGGRTRGILRHIDTLCAKAKVGTPHNVRRRLCPRGPNGPCNRMLRQAAHFLKLAGTADGPQFTSKCPIHKLRSLCRPHSTGHLPVALLKAVPRRTVVLCPQYNGGGQDQGGRGRRPRRAVPHAAQESDPLEQSSVLLRQRSAPALVRPRSVRTDDDDSVERGGGLRRDVDALYGLLDIAPDKAEAIGGLEVVEKLRHLYNLPCFGVLAQRVKEQVHPLLRPVLSAPQKRFDLCGHLRASRVLFPPCTPEGTPSGARGTEASASASA